MSIVTKTVRAEQDLEEIWFYIALDNVVAADNLLDDIDSSCQLLAMQPQAGRLRPELAPELRTFPVGRYVNPRQLFPLLGFIHSMFVLCLHFHLPPW